MSEVLFTPSADAVRASQLDAFRRAIEQRHGVELADSRALHAWSIAHIGKFWRAVYDELGVLGDSAPDARTVVDLERMPGARFFPDTRLNFAENLLHGAGVADDALALICADERGTYQRVSYAALRGEVAHAEKTLLDAGVVEGDRVAAFLPNIAEAIIYALAAAGLGAVFSSCSPDFGASGVIDRFGQIEPKVLVVADGYRYAGKAHSVLAKARALVDAVPSITRTVVVPVLDAAPSLEGLRGAVLHAPAPAHAGPPTFRRLPFDHPLYVLFSSGTTGLPKCIVHGAGGTLLQHLKEHRLHADLRPGTRMFYFATCAWMMWNWLVSGLASGACLVLYDGSPFAPNASALFDLADREDIELFGVSAKYLDAVAKVGLRPRKTHKLTSVARILSTGSPLSPEAFDFVYEHIKPDVQLASISGGTDIISCFVGGDPTKPVRRGEIQAPGLGMAVEVFDDEGKRVFDEQGELVCTRPFPSMPLGLYGDEDGHRYHDAYFSRFEGVWTHGDFTAETATGFVITGRSDATLNPGGVRIGTAELYRPVERFAEIQESVAVGQRFGGDVRVLLFVVMTPGHSLDDALRERLRVAIRGEASPRHVPAKILAVDAIPRTRSGKISELSVRRAVEGQPIPNVGSLANPESLEAFRGRPELDS